MTPHDPTPALPPARVERELPYEAVSVNADGMEWRVPLWDAINTRFPHDARRSTDTTRLKFVRDVERACEIAMRVALRHAIRPSGEDVSNG